MAHSLRAISTNLMKVYLKILEVLSQWPKPPSLVHKKLDMINLQMVNLKCRQIKWFMKEEKMKKKKVRLNSHSKILLLITMNQNKKWHKRKFSMKEESLLWRNSRNLYMKEVTSIDARLMRQNKMILIWPFRQTEHKRMISYL